MRLAHALAAAILLAASTTASASPLNCPAELAADDGAGGTEAVHKFRYVSFFDGDPSEMADLAPEEGPNPKLLEQRWQLTRTAGRPIVMVCRYHGTDRTLRQEVPPDVQECRLNGFIDATGEIIGSPTLECR
ncbi:MAG: hypothetical protein KBA31_21605 [Alphaproteobacteria bacterium]|nr:hypothetical protein [Alphaproteobacteria bacterium]